MKKMFSQRWLMVFAAFVMAALIIFSGCAGAASSYETAEVYYSHYSESPKKPPHRDASKHVREALPKSAKKVKRDDDQTRRLQSLEQAQRARRTLSRW